MDDTDRDDALAAAAAAGDKTALGDLHRRHAKTLWRVAYSITQSSADADDASAETWLAIVRGIHSFGGRSSWLTWATKITIREARRTAKTTRQLPTLTCDMLALDTPVLADNPDIDTRQALARGLAKLTPPLRQALALRYWAGLSTDEAANAAGVREGTLRVRLLRAKRQLMAELPMELMPQRSYVAEGDYVTVGGEINDDPH